MKTISTKTSEASYLLAQHTAISRLQHCSLTGAVLSRPIVSDYHGRMFNKQAVVEKLLANATGADDNIFEFSSLGDFVELRLTLVSETVSQNPATSNNHRGTNNDESNGKYICPLTGDILGSDSARRRNINFLYFAECGCVLSDEVIRLGLVKLEKQKDDVFNYEIFDGEDDNEKLEKLRKEARNIIDKQSSKEGELAKDEVGGADAENGKENDANEVNKCPNCNTKISLFNLIYICPPENSAESEKQTRRNSWLKRLGVSHSLKLVKKKKKKKIQDKKRIRDGGKDINKGAKKVKKSSNA